MLIKGTGKEIANRMAHQNGNENGNIVTEKVGEN
jgi:hypothetical protein